MNRLTFTISLLFISLLSVAEDIPEGYYSQAVGKKDSLLKRALYEAVCGGERYEYGTNQYHSTSNPPSWEKGDLKAYGTWYAFPLTDRREDGTIWDMYSLCNRYFPHKQGESACSMNIEHCLPKSWWGGEVNNAYKDLYNLNPSDQRANSQKSNYPPGHVLKGDKFDNGSFRMDSKSKSQYGYACYEPAEEYRGDFARTYFYMVTAYTDLGWSTPYIDATRYQMFTDVIVGVLLDWHRADPVSEKERCRADYISSLQHNRNPYIDYPELVEYIWGDKKGQSWSLPDADVSFTDCPEWGDNEPYESEYDTLLSLSAVTAALVRTVEGGYASEKVQSNGTAALTMGTSSTDGYVSFSKLCLPDNATLVLRASIYNTAQDMQLNIYSNRQLLYTLTDTTVQETRNEKFYRLSIPQHTDSLTIMSVGGSTAHRACIQEIYLLAPKKMTDLEQTETKGREYKKVLRNGRVEIETPDRTYLLNGISY
ncbi:MAG: endonuclease [Paludibacteraceae bacterium]|nr:endonuclease [Paludibacteraceae bacterium]